MLSWLIVHVHPTHYPVESGLEAGHSLKPGRHGGIGNIHARLGYTCRALEEKVSLCDIKLTLQMPLPTEWTPDTRALPLRSLGRNQIVGGNCLSKLCHEHVAQRQFPAMDLHFHRALAQAHLRG